MTVRYRVVHSVSGRVRLRFPPGIVGEHEPALRAGLTDAVGVRAVDVSRTTGSVVIHYDAGRASETTVLSTMARLFPSAATEVALTRSASQIFPSDAPLLQLAGSVAGLVASFAPVPTALTASLAVGSGLPLITRAARTLWSRGRLGVDVLDGVTLILLAAHGNYRAASLLTGLLSLGQWILDRTVVQSRRSLRELFAAPEPLVRKLDTGRGARARDAYSHVAVGSLRVGDVVVLRARQQIPVDGEVVSGEALVDQRTMTGEALPVERRRGDRVYASTFVEDGQLAVRAERVGLDTAVGRIIQVIEAAAGEKPELQVFAENLADRLVSKTLVLAGLGAAVARSADAGIAILIADYGTAVRVALPTAALVAAMRASGEGILVKGPRVLEQLARVNTVVFDKTGTLTSGTPRVTDVRSYVPTVTAADVVRLAAAAEHDVPHPVARAISRAAEARGVDVPRPVAREFRVGLGVEMRVHGGRVLVGSRRFMEAEQVVLDAAEEVETAAHAAGAALTFVTVDGVLAGVLVLQDELRTDAGAAVAALRARGMRNIVMVSGDHSQPTRLIAQSLGVRHYYPDLLPEDKAALIRGLRADNRVVAMVGDGVNDALALKAADVGIAVQGGAEVVMEAAGVVLLQGGLDRVVRAIDVAREGIGRFRRTLDVAVAANLAAVGLASLGLAGPSAAVLISNGAAVASALSAQAISRARTSSRAAPARPRRAISPR